MSRDERPRKPIPLLLWALIGFVLVLGFLFILRAMNTPSAGFAPPTPDIAAPATPS